MKFINPIAFFAILIVLFNITSVNNITTESKKFLTKSKTELNSDSIYARIRALIMEISNQRLKAENLTVKKKIAGALPDGYPEIMIRNARRHRSDKKFWAELMGFPTEVWRFCLFPLFKINYKKHCTNQYSTGTEDEINGKCLID